MTPTGLEHPSDSRQKQGSAAIGGPDSSTLKADSTATGLTGTSDIQAVINAWPTLPATVRANILSLIRSAAGEG